MCILYNLVKIHRYMFYVACFLFGSASYVYIFYQILHSNTSISTASIVILVGMCLEIINWLFVWYKYIDCVSKCQVFAEKFLYPLVMLIVLYDVFMMFFEFSTTFWASEICFKFVLRNLMFFPFAFAIATHNMNPTRSLRYENDEIQVIIPAGN